MSLWARSNLDQCLVWGNDIYPPLIAFWRQARDNNESLCNLVSAFQGHYHGQKSKCLEWDKVRLTLMETLDSLPTTEAGLATRFFVLNRSTSGGSTDSGGMTAAAYCDRFTESSIDRLRALDLSGIRFTCGDYKKLLDATPNKDGVFIFLDPPYLSAEKSALYGKNGSTHKGFNHAQLSEALKRCSHSWIMTLDDCPETRELYSWAPILSWVNRYGMGQGKAVSEMLILSEDVHKSYGYG